MNVPVWLWFATIAALLGIRHFVIAVNKMDLIKFEQGVFNDVFEHFMPFLGSLGIVEPYVLPMSALLGDNVVERSANIVAFRQVGCTPVGVGYAQPIVGRAVEAVAVVLRMPASDGIGHRFEPGGIPALSGSQHARRRRCGWSRGRSGPDCKTPGK